MIKIIIINNIQKQAHANETEKATETLCGAINDGTLWTEAGYDTTFGSFYNQSSPDSTSILVVSPPAPRVEKHGETGKSSIGAITSTTTSSSTENFGSCMGAPCYDDISWGNGCDVVCICPMFTESVDDDDDNFDDDAVDGDTCFANGQGSEWMASTTELAVYISDLISQYDSFDSSKLSSTCNTCNVAN